VGDRVVKTRLPGVLAISSRHYSCLSILFLYEKWPMFLCCRNLFQRHQQGL
jgi:hypothetical protein